MKGKVLTSWSLMWLIAAVLFFAGAALNLSFRASHDLPPTDGVAWTQKDDGIYAEKILPNQAGSRAGIVKGDKLLAISLDEKNFDEIASPADIEIYLSQAGIDGNLTYFVERTSYKFADNKYYVDLTRLESLPRWTPSIILLGIVGLIWFGVGLFVLFKQGSRSPFVLHFATVCLTAFVFLTYHSVGVGKDLDLAIALLDDIAYALFVPLFLHFCLRYPVRSEVFNESRWKDYLLYVPSIILNSLNIIFSLSYYIIPENSAEQMAIFIDKFHVFQNLYFAYNAHFIAGITISSVVILWRYFTNQQAIVRQRLKWAMFGTILAVLPIISFTIAKRFINLPDDLTSIAFTTLPLVLIPLAFGHSVVRYRLMDVDVVVRRAFVYAFTTIAIAMLIGAVALSLIYFVIGKQFSSADFLPTLIAIIAMGAIVLLSEPLKNFLQERADRFFYGERYDARRGLLDFGRTLSATTSLEPLLNALTERLRQVLDVEKVAVFVEDGKDYRLAKSIGLSSDYTVPNDFRQMIREKSAQKGIVRADELELDTEISDGQGFVRQELHYYVPCVARGEMVAVIGLGRASDGSLLSSEDLEILQTVSGYIAVAVENSLLYQEQEKRANELALLKEFNESIVESVNVGLLAVDANGTVIRCNSTFEEIIGKKREEILNQTISDIFDKGFASNISQILGKKLWLVSELRHAYKLHTKNAKGKNLILNVAIAPLRSFSSQQKGAIIVLENVTSRIKLEESLQQNEKLSSIGLLAAGIAHEVNTPLTGVSSYTQMLLGMIPETDPKHKLLQKIQTQTERASNIAGNLLNFSRAGNSSEFDEIDINKTLDDTLQLLEPQMRKSGVEIVRE
nr:PAS domain S-box protein [Pyrinomonadaceae bacterium]